MPKEAEEPMLTPRGSKTWEEKQAKELSKSRTEFEGIWMFLGMRVIMGESRARRLMRGREEGESFVAFFLWRWLRLLFLLRDCRRGGGSDFVVRARLSARCWDRKN
jgi:hypothetical protein